MDSQSKSSTEAKPDKLSEAELRLACAFVQGRAANSSMYAFKVSDLELFIRELRRTNLV